MERNSRLKIPTVICYYEDYLKLVNLGRLVIIYRNVKDDLPLFLRLYDRIKKEKLNKQQIVELLKTPNRLLDQKEKVDRIMTTYGIYIQKKSKWKRK